jgi:hypothetical protein
MSERVVIKASDWAAGLRRAFDGQRNSVIDRLGGLDEVIRVDIANSADAGRSTDELYEAFREIVPNFQWRPAVRLRATSMMLDVLHAFPTRHGGPKIVELLQSWKSGSSSLEVYPDRFVDVRLQALQVLETYYPSPLDESREWDAYVDVLHELLRRAQQPLYIIERLRRIDGKNLPARVQALIADDNVLNSIVAAVLKTGGAKDALSFLYGLCTPDRIAAFEEAVRKAGGTVEELQETAVIRVDKKQITVEPTDEEILQGLESGANQFPLRIDMYAPSGNGHGVPQE